MHGSGSGLLDPVLDNTLSLNKRGGSASFGAKVVPCLGGQI